MEKTTQMYCILAFLCPKAHRLLKDGFNPNNEEAKK